MGTIKLDVSDTAIAINLLESSLKRELFLLDKSISNTKLKLKEFEKQRGMDSHEFYGKFKQGLLGDEQDTMLWAAEYESLELLEAKRLATENILGQCK